MFALVRFFISENHHNRQSRHTIFIIWRESLTFLVMGLFFHHGTNLFSDLHGTDGVTGFSLLCHHHSIRLHMHWLRFLRVFPASSWVLKKDKEGEKVVIDSFDLSLSSFAPDFSWHQRAC